MEYKKIFFDFEVFKYDWLVVMIDYQTKKKHVIVNDDKELLRVYNNIIKMNYILVGYNSRNYDTIIMKSILLGLNPFEVNNKIINQGMKEYQILGENREKFPILNFDISTRIHSLKQLEGFMGSSIVESSIDFTIKRKLTTDEINETIKYCTHDVEQTIEVFENRKEEFDSQASLIETFNLPLEDFNRTKAQLVAKILGAKQQEHNDEFELIYPDTLKLDKYKYVLDWFKDPKNHKIDKQLYTTIAGIPHVIGWGGLHGSKDNYIFHGKMLCADVASLYPSIMIEYKLLSRNVEKPKLYKEIRDTRIKLKKAHDPKQYPYKIVLNSTYGASGDKFNPLNDPKMCRNVCVTGQLLLIDLIEKLEPYCELLQSNTDGVYLGFTKNIEENISKCKEIMNEWQCRVRLTLEIDEADGVIQKDVNNYILIEGDKFKTKGAYVKKLSKIDYDLPILNTALLNYFTKNISVEDTINNCNKLIEFQKIVKVSNLYKYAMYGDKKLREHVLRVFASKNPEAKGVFKVKTEDRIEKIANTPEKCFINNNNVVESLVPDELDKQYYIDLAKKRISDFLDPRTNSHKEKNEIKGLSNEVKNKIEDINKNKKYSSFLDLLYNMKEIGCGNSQFETLIKLDYLNSYGDINKLLFEFELFKEIGSCKNISKDKAEKFGIDIEIIKKHCEKYTEKSFNKINNIDLINDLIKSVSIKNCTIIDKCKYQMQYTGDCDIIDSNVNGSIYLFKEIDTNKYGTQQMNLYRIFDGVNLKTYFDKQWYSECPCIPGDALDCIFRWKPKHKKNESGKWIETGETERVLQVYRKV
jgi:hypothetical protein